MEAHDGISELAGGETASEKRCQHEPVAAPHRASGVEEQAIPASCTASVLEVRYSGHSAMKWPPGPTVNLCTPPPFPFPDPFSPAVEIVAPFAPTTVAI